MNESVVVRKRIAVRRRRFITVILLQCGNDGKLCKINFRLQSE